MKIVWKYERILTGSTLHNLNEVSSGQANRKSVHNEGACFTDPLPFHSCPRFVIRKGKGCGHFTGKHTTAVTWSVALALLVQVISYFFPMETSQIVQPASQLHRPAYIGNENIGPQNQGNDSSGTIWAVMFG